MSRQFQIAIKQIRNNSNDNPLQYLIDEQNKQRDISKNIDVVQNSSMQGLREVNDTIPDYQPPLIDTVKNTVKNGVQDFVGGVKWYGTHPTQLANEVENGLAIGLTKLGVGGNDLNIANIEANSSFAPMAEFGQQQIVALQAQQDYRDAHPSTTALGKIGEFIPEIPLWTTGEGLVGKVGSKILPKATEKIASKIPAFIKGGLKDAVTYGTVVAPTEAIANGDNTQQFLDRESQLPSVALGGMALRGAGSVFNSGLKAVNPELKLASELKSAELATDNNIQSLNNPLQDFQNAYKTPTQAEFKATLPPRQNGAYKFTTGEQRALNEYNQGIQTAQNYIGHNDVLAGYPPGTTIDEYYGFREPLFQMSLSHLSGKNDPLLRTESHPNFLEFVESVGKFF
ncbi:hypothetical protein, partial [Desulfitobacterium metallireducens]|uniref:Uncharacterized protein n=1 Tax=Desulfitobacterium metallireducens DSM 15288 TaxID=871968 RepID=W0ECR4_9FIRM